jgi:hypothetical protein
MSKHAFDTFTRQTADAVSRRGSLLTLGGAALAAGLAGAGGTRAGKKSGKGKKCKKQVGKCREGLADVCAALFPGNQDNIDECFDLFAECCAFLKACNAGQAFACAAEIAKTIDP